MKKQFLITFLHLLIFISITAQENNKIKGNRNVTIVTTEIAPFKTIALDEDFKIEIIQGEFPTVEIETDENLHEVIEFKIMDSTLTFDTNSKITSKKRLNIKVTYDNSLKRIETSDDSEILSLTTVKINDINVKAKGSSKIGLTVKSDNFYFHNNDKAKVKLNVTSNRCTFILSDNSKTNALINSKALSLSLYQRAQANLEGSCDDAKLDVDNNSQYNGKNLTINACELTTGINGVSHVEVVNQININASGNSSIYLYENPKIEINKFTGTAKLENKKK